MTITPELIAQHQLTQGEYDKIVSLLGREPSYTELGVFSVMWSEHCSYKSSRIHLKKLPTEGKYVVQGPGENAGVIGIGGGWVVAFKIESHNHPSYIEPFQGAATGVGGILRDIFTMGARPIAVMDSLRFGLPPQGTSDHSPVAVHNLRILSGVVSGIAHYGNCFGVPTVGGETVFEDCYAGNPLVNVFALGVCKEDEIFYARASGIGNPVIYVGAKTGRDGIHGASMASAEFTEESKQKRPNVQVGDPFLEKLLLEACIEAMKTGAIVAIQDMGAAGLTSSSCEMGSRGGVGIDIDLDLVPQRERGMTAYEMLLSESQERMLIVAEKGREEEVFRVFRKWGLDAVTIGVVTPDGNLRIRHKGEVVAEIPNPALADEAPKYDRPHNVRPFRKAPLHPPAIPASQDLNADLLRLIASPDLCSKRWIWEQYDYQVRTNTLAGPGSDAAVVRIKETGQSVAMSLDGNGRYCYLDPREGAKLAVAECCRNLSVTGALPVAATNNLNFGNPERPEIMAQLVEAVEGIAEACTHFETPITGGNVSLYNETLGEGIYPTPVLGIIGLMKTAAPVPVAFQREGAHVFLLGGFRETDATRFGSGEYAKVILGQLWGLPPQLDMAYEKRVHEAMREIVAAGLAESAHDLSDGGIAIALSESCTSAIGAKIRIPAGSRVEFDLFGEAPSRILVTTSSPEQLKEIMSRHGVEGDVIGVTMKGRLQIGNESQMLIDVPTLDLKQSFETALPQLIQNHAG
jgi:phosphoribosylformylglycinamidine synthase II